MMQSSTKASSYFYIALICAIWFLLTSWFWQFFANLFISFPFGLLALYCWNKGRKIELNSIRFQFIFWMLAAGTVIALVSLVLLLIYN